MAARERPRGQGAAGGVVLAQGLHPVRAVRAARGVGEPVDAVPRHAEQRGRPCSPRRRLELQQGLHPGERAQLLNGAGLHQSSGGADAECTPPFALEDPPAAGSAPAIGCRGELVKKGVAPVGTKTQEFSVS